MTPTITVADTEQLYAERMARYVTAMRGGRPDRVPLRPLAAEICARHAGYTCQQVTHDYNLGFQAVIRTCLDFPFDAVVPNMVYVWTGLTEAAGLRYYGVPGIHVGADVGFQYREPAEDQAFMKADEYDDFIADPMRFLWETWLPRVSADVEAGGMRRSVALVKSSMAMLNYFASFGPQVERMRSECGTVSAIAGMLKAPLDVLGDKFRGYLGLAFDLMERPEKVLAACQALMPHLGYIALTSADPSHNVPIPIWMHRGCVPFISRAHFESIYWPTLRPIVEALWAQGNQTLFYAEGKWDAHLERFAELPAGSIIYHIDRGDPVLTHRVLGRKFCLSGGVPNTLLAFGTADQVKAHCRKLIETIGADGRYIMDASAIMQNDATVENLRAMTDATLEYGRYGAAPAVPDAPAATATGLPEWARKAGINIPYDESRAILGDAAIVRRVWEANESFAYTYIWHLVLSF